VELHLLAIACPAGWLLRPPAPRGLLAGLWSWPWAAPVPAAAAAAEAAIPYRAGETRSWPGWVQVYSHRRETVHPLALWLPVTPALPPGLAWVAPGDLAGLPLGRRDQRLRDLLEEPSSLLPWNAEDWAAAVGVLGR
jgi:A/G-specific adenine glycosylase